MSCVLFLLPQVLNVPRNGPGLQELRTPQHLSEELSGSDKTQQLFNLKQNQLGTGGQSCIWLHRKGVAGLGLGSEDQRGCDKIITLGAQSLQWTWWSKVMLQGEAPKALRRKGM